MRSDIVRLINTGTVDIGLLYSRYNSFFGGIDPNLFNQVIRIYAQSVGIVELYRWKVNEYEINILRKENWIKAF